MRGRKLRLFSLVIAIAMIVAVLAGCSGEQKKNETTGSTQATDGTEAQSTAAALNPDEPGWKNDKTPVTLDWYAGFSWLKLYDWGTKPVQKNIEEKTGVKINYIIPAGDEEQKLNTMIASNSLPDVITIDYWSAGRNTVIQAEQVYDLSGLAKQYDPYFFKASSPGIVAWHSDDQGRLFGYPNFAVGPEQITPDCPIGSTQTFLVRKDIYEAIGKPDMRTPEGFLAALQAAREKFPEINGKPLNPLGFTEFNQTGTYSLSYLTGMLAIPFEDESGNYYNRQTHPEYVKWLKTLRKAYESKLIIDDAFIDKTEQINEKVMQGSYFALWAPWGDIGTQNSQLYKNSPERVYICVDGPANSKLDPYQLDGPNPMGWMYNMITKNCKNPEKAIKFFTYMISEEGQRDVRLGIQGTTWEFQGKEAAYLPEIRDMLLSPGAAVVKEQYGFSQPNFFENQLYTLKWYPTLKDPNDPSYINSQWAMGKGSSAGLQYSAVWPESGSELESIDIKSQELFGSMVVKLITARNDAEFDSMFEQYKAKLDEIGYSKLADYYTQEGKKVKDKLEKLGFKQ